MYVGKFMRSLVVGRVPETATDSSSLATNKTVGIHLVVVVSLGFLLEQRVARLQ